MKQFSVYGIDKRKRTLLHETEPLSAAIRWLNGYTRYENAGNWETIIVKDSKGNTVHVWETQS